jgi:hypothetical protein
MRTRVSGAAAGTIFASIANGPTPASMLPQFGEVSIVPCCTPAWANK